MNFAALVAAADFEVIPLKGVLEKVSILDAGTAVTVTVSPAKGIDSTIDLALELQSMGYEAVAHLSARLIKGRSQLEAIIGRLSDGGVQRVFVVGGDGHDTGEFEDGVALLQAMHEIGHPFTRVGIPGYPDGHSTIPDGRLRDALLDKEPYASYIATQMCFSADRIVSWIDSIRSDGVQLPVKIGLPGVVDLARLVAVGSKIGVGDSLRYLAKDRSVFKMIRPGPYKPDKLLRQIVDGAGDMGLGGLHIFTFNQVEATVEWAKRVLETG